ncbi:ferritin [Clostridium aestuarii]|uniref:Ferritin n=1 Tax=Clostridium aestuarii TaxID=338193 RepID=A0ABT4D4Y5_9CLOT|nr:ferritin [Clostridium aestuarii]MCY6485260.1 ferritin [Clostridium aestuarii]
MISQKLFEELNKQINYELYSAHLYLAMAAYCASQDLDGFTNFFKVQAEEEKFHAMKLFDYVNEMDGTVKLDGLDIPQNEYPTILDVFKSAYEHEKFVTSRIYFLSDIAMEEREHATISMLKWYIDEQVEEESTFSSIIKKLERIKDDSNVLYMLDKEFAQRSFTPPNEV